MTALIAAGIGIAALLIAGSLLKREREREWREEYNRFLSALAEHLYGPVPTLTWDDFSILEHTLGYDDQADSALYGLSPEQSRRVLEGDWATKEEGGTP